MCVYFEYMFSCPQTKLNLGYLNSPCREATLSELGPPRSGSGTATLVPGTSTWQNFEDEARWSRRGSRAPGENAR